MKRRASPCAGMKVAADIACLQPELTLGVRITQANGASERLENILPRCPQLHHTQVNTHTHTHLITFFCSTENSFLFLFPNLV